MAINYFIKKGDTYKCIKDVKMSSDGRTEYVAGKIYTSEQDGCLTDESGIIEHYWLEEDSFEKHFIPYNKNTNNVNHPSHYNKGNIECIDAMISAYGKDTVSNFCICNAFKYIWRYKYKNGIEDLKKAQWYLNKIVELNN